MEINWDKVKDAFRNPEDIGNIDLLKGYESPITSFVQDAITEQIKNQEDQLTYVMSQTIGYQIDKENLVKALQYDREQYRKGYVAGRQEATNRIFKMVNQLSEKRQESNRYYYMQAMEDAINIIKQVWLEEEEE